MSIFHERLVRQGRSLELMIVLAVALLGVVQWKAKALARTADAAVEVERSRTRRLQEQLDGALEHIHARAQDAEPERAADEA